MNLRDFRAQYPFKPHQLLIYNQITVVEAVSYPFDNSEFRGDNMDDDKPLPTIMVRMIPGDPSSIQEVFVSQVSLGCASGSVRESRILYMDHYKDPDIANFEAKFSDSLNQIISRCRE